MKNFEARLEKLEKIGENIRDPNIPLETALSNFEGIKLARGLTSDLEKVEARIEILLNPSEDGPDKEPETTLFDNEAISSV
ncbi:MAG: exodeoxyribonuclease VII small subunit [Termitinemataceae bacterium]|nr:MAG: exodeoxyribonuclease VII small subunit [Termitinemataceae bacterium]